MPIQTCPECNNQFQVPDYLIKIGKGKFCSRECYTKARQSHKYVLEKSHRWKGGKSKLICETCGKEFEVYPYRVKKTLAKYCSIECRGKARSKLIMGENHPNYKEKIEKVCEFCGKEIKVRAGSEKNGRGKYCSVECRGKARSEKYVGKNSPRWLGGLSFDPYCEKFNENFKTRVRAFFNNTCLICGRTKNQNFNENMSVHHVHYNKNTCCDESTPLFATICRYCHPATNMERDYWSNFLTNKIMTEFHGKCFYTKEEFKKIS